MCIVKYRGKDIILIDLIFFAFTFVFTVDGVDTDFFVILFESSQIFTGFREFTFFHTFTNIPGNDGWWLVIDTDFETSWAPVDELDGSLGFDVSNRCVDILWNNITAVQEAACHVFTVSWITFDHLVGWLEASVGDFRDGELFVVCFFGRDYWCVGGEREVNTWVWG